MIVPVIGEFSLYWSGIRGVSLLHRYTRGVVPDIFFSAQRSRPPPYFLRTSSSSLLHSVFREVNQTLSMVVLQFASVVYRRPLLTLEACVTIEDIGFNTCPLYDNGDDLVETRGYLLKSSFSQRAHQVLRFCES